MNRYYITLCFFTIAIKSFSQTTYESYPKTLFSTSDSFQLKWQISTTPYSRPIGKTDTMNFNSTGIAIVNGVKQHLSVTLYYGHDSTTFTYRNKPFGQYHYVTIQSAKGKSVVRIGFEPTPAIYTPEYINASTGTAKFEIPEVYELANIIWLLSPTGQRATDLVKEGTYYNKVMKHFGKYKNHPIFKKLDFPDSTYFSKYYEFRENSACYSFSKNGKLVAPGPYHFVFGNDYWDGFQNLFKELIPLVEDLAAKSQFRKFYRDNQSYYKQLTLRQQQLMPVKSMWNWLENNFPRPKYDAYKIIFSPLIKGSHSTQNFSFLNEYNIFRECVMFVCGPERYDSNKALHEKQKEGLMSGIVFTEIDHNYVNTASNRYRQAIDSIFSTRKIWAGNGGGNTFYGSPMSVFNEYMTHSLFCLWVMDTYEKPIADFVIGERETLMVERRYFIRFREFNKELMALHAKDRNIKAIDLYPAILEWCRKQM